MHSARRVVVTGGAGFIGSHLCETLLRSGDEVVCLDNFLTGTPSNLGHLMDHPRFITWAFGHYLRIAPPEFALAGGADEDPPAAEPVAAAA